MTDYKTIRGKKVKFFTSDLSGGEAEGQLFIQDTAREMKVVHLLIVVDLTVLVVQHLETHV